jgi:type VI secretion system protein ImpC
MAFIVGVIGDFSGYGPQEPGPTEQLADRRFLEIDRDNFEQIFRRLSPRIELELPFCSSIGFGSWEDFHPERLVERLPALSSLLAAREEVGNPPRMRRLIAESGVDPAVAEGAEAVADSAPGRSARPETTEADLLDAIVEGRALEGRPRIVKPSADPEFDRMISEIVGSSADRTDYAQQERWQSAIDRELAARAGAILHHPGFQRLEAAWCSLRKLVWHSESGEALRIRLLDLSRADLLADLDAAEDPASTILHRRVYEEEKGTPGGEPYSLLLLDFAFAGGEEDLRLLEHLAGLAERAELPCIAGLAPSLWSGGEIDWARAAALVEGVRGLQGARWIGLCCPRLLLRLPYGPETDPLDRFEFDENARGDRLESYLWGSSTFALGRAAVQAFATFGTLAAVPKLAQIEDLPVHVYRAEGEVCSTGPSDRLLTDSEIERLKGLGLIPVAAARGRDLAFIASFRSVTGAPLFAD